MSVLFEVDTVLGKQSTLELRSLHVGGLYHAEEEIQMTSSLPNFVGAMQQFEYNSQNYFEMARSAGGTSTQKGILRLLMLWNVNRFNFRLHPKNKPSQFIYFYSVSKN